MKQMPHIEATLQVEGFTPNAEGSVPLTEAQMQSLEDHITAQETRITDHENQLTERNNRITELEAEVTALKATPAETTTNVVNAETSEHRQYATGAKEYMATCQRARELFNQIS